MMLWLGVIFFAQVCSGFDATLTGNFQSFTMWKKETGTPNTSEIGLITAIYFVGTLCGSIPGSVITDKLCVLSLQASMAMLIW